ncbi:RNA-binding protein [Pseudorhodoplanes sp.]|uniref:RNA-binding protein n=1 Tax=Pseudorhodoplanes sp. TaxID=1934341 RepID=UPI002CA613B3|nr:RNA-binding protein [Pseudorhodoplanes sp.]HWV53780.1 RNA-binding protein [Pseudorhodoplanes sp.]
MLAVLDDTALDSGPHKGAATERLCVVERTVKPVDELIRFVVGPDGSVVPDVKRNLPGRGLWVTATRAALETAIRRKLFAKGFKREVRAGADLGEVTDRLLERAALDSLSIAGKAGSVTTGFTKVEAALNRDNPVGLLHASDGSEDGLRKLKALLRRNEDGEGPEIPVIRSFSGAQLDLALGRSNVIHAALLAGPASQGFLTRCLRMMRFRTGDTEKPGLKRAQD